MDQLTAAGKQIRNPQILYHGSMFSGNQSAPDFTITNSKPATDKKQIQTTLLRPAQAHSASHMQSGVQG